MNLGMNFSNPHIVVGNFGLSEAATVVDLGAGSGFYSLAAARIVGEEGKVYAVDIQKDLLTKLKEAMRFEGVSNIDTVWGNIEQHGGSRVASGIADAVFVCNTLFQIEEKDVLAQEVARIIRPTGRLLFVDWSDYHSGLGPDAKHIVSPEDARALFEKNGFSHEKDLDAGDHHYGFVMRKDKPTNK